jgi:CheY-like chemotaxis protein
MVGTEVGCLRQASTVIYPPITPETSSDKSKRSTASERSAPLVASPPGVEILRPAASRASILVVDNLSVNVELMRSLLEPSGYFVFSADNVDDGLELARQTSIDLIISDVHMPNKDGYIFIQAVKSDPGLRQIPFMFLSSTMGREDDARRGAAFGADKFIVRPIDPQALLAEVETMLKSKGR